jgi:acetyl esterase/lipase
MPGCPPVFLAQAADDPVSPIENSLLMFAALRRVGVRPEMHIFQSGGHGWGLGAAGSEVAAWPQRYANWVASLA